MILIIFKSKETGDALIPPKGYLRLWAINAAKESVDKIIKQMDSIDE